MTTSQDCPGARPRPKRIKGPRRLDWQIADHLRGPSDSKGSASGEGRSHLVAVEGKHEIAEARHTDDHLTQEYSRSRRSTNVAPRVQVLVRLPEKDSNLQPFG
jgi:hypothetical protein